MPKPLLRLLNEAKEEDKSKSLGYFAERTGIDKGYISRVARHKVESEDQELYKKLAKELHVDPEDITEYVELLAKEKLENKPELASAILDELTADLTVRMGEATDEEKQEIMEMVDEYWEKRHGKKS